MTKDLKMPIVRDMLRVNYKEIDKAIWLFL